MKLGKKIIIIKIINMKKKYIMKMMNKEIK